MFSTNAAAIANSFAFCIDNSNAVVKSDQDACSVNSNGDHSDEQPVYQMSVKRLGNTPATINTFTLTTTWASLKSADPNTVQLTYKVYP